MSEVMYGKLFPLIFISVTGARLLRTSRNIVFHKNHISFGSLVNIFNSDMNATSSNALSFPVEVVYGDLLCFGTFMQRIAKITS